MDSEQHREAAELLRRAEVDCQPIAPLTAKWPEMDVGDAYEIQLLNIRRRIDDGALVKGHKVGLSSRAMQRMMGVDEPDYGHLLHDMFIYEGDTVDASRYCFPRVEVEVGFVLADRLEGPGCTAADVIRATDYIVPSIELIDSRIRDWKITLPDTIADNASSAGVVIGANPTQLDDVDVRLIGVILQKNGEIVETGVSGAVLGNPVTAVAWLANRVHAFGVTLEPGHVVLPGSCTRAIDVGAGDFIHAEFGTLGSVSVSFG